LAYLLLEFCRTEFVINVHTTRPKPPLPLHCKRSADQLVSEMVESDLKSAERDALAIRHGYDAYNVRET
jgi:hypothetical protein